MLSDNEQRLLTYLSDNKFHSGDDLAAEFSVSRAAISIWVKKLNQQQIPISSVKGKGYQLAKHISLLRAGEIASQLPSDVLLDCKVISGSTNDTVKQLFKHTSIAVATTEQQTAGRGRRGREWISPFGENLYFSLGVELPVSVAALSGLSLAVGISVGETLIEQGFPVTLKWPNDIYLEGKKLAGILIELDGALDSSARVIIGIGLNTNMSVNNPSIDQAWNSLSLYAGKVIDRSKLLAHLLNNLLVDIQYFVEHGLVGRVERWNELDHYYQQPIQLLMPNKTVRGTGQGIDESGALLLATENGIETHIAGEISVRPANQFNEQVSD